MRSPAADLLAAVADAFTRSGIAWYLFGAQAAILHGSVRFTGDVDVTVRLPESVSLADLVNLLRDAGFQQRLGDPGFIEQTRVIPLVHIGTGMPLDVVLSGPGLEDQFFTRLVWRDIDGVRVPVISPEDLIVAKVLAGRPKDIDDVVAVAAAYQERLDTAYIEDILVEIGRALAQDDLLPVYRRAFERAARRL